MEKDWSNLSKDFDKLQDYVAGKESADIIRAKVAELENLGKVVELGCGNGNFTQVIAQNADEVIATDISEKMLEMAKDKLKDFENVKLQKHNSYKIELPDNYCDTIFMANLIHVVAEPQKVIAEAKRILKKEGKLIIISYTMDQMKMWDLLSLMYRYTKAFGKRPKRGTPFKLDTLKNFINQNGFKTLKAECIGGKTKSLFLLGKVL